MQCYMSITYQIKKKTLRRKGNKRRLEMKEKKGEAVKKEEQDTQEIETMKARKNKLKENLRIS